MPNSLWANIPDFIHKVNDLNKYQRYELSLHDTIIKHEKYGGLEYNDCITIFSYLTSFHSFKKSTFVFNAQIFCTSAKRWFVFRHQCPLLLFCSPWTHYRGAALRHWSYWPSSKSSIQGKTGVAGPLHLLQFISLTWILHHVIRGIFINTPVLVLCRKGYPSLLPFRLFEERVTGEKWQWVSKRKKGNGFGGGGSSPVNNGAWPTMSYYFHVAASETGATPN